MRSDPDYPHTQNAVVPEGFKKLATGPNASEELSESTVRDDAIPDSFCAFVNHQDLRPSSVTDMSSDGLLGATSSPITLQASQISSCGFIIGRSALLNRNGGLLYSKSTLNHDELQQNPLAGLMVMLTTSSIGRHDD